MVQPSFNTEAIEITGKLAVACNNADPWMTTSVYDNVINHSVQASALAAADSLQ